MSEFNRPRLDFHIGDKKLCLGFETKIMGVLNVTPDSFSDGGRFESPAAAQRRALRMEQEGAHFIDVGGESSRPGARPVSAAEEIRRIRPVLKRLSRCLNIPISVDTCKYDVAQVALDEGAIIVNDITGLRRGRRRLAKLIVRYQAGLVLMHMKGSPRFMQEGPTYRDVVKETSGFLCRALGTALDAGISPRSLMVDPGFGFGKTLEHNLQLLRHLDAFLKLRCPVLVGLSRKSFLGALRGVPVSGRLYGSLAAAAAAIQRGAHVLRVHDVLAHRQLASVLDATLARGAGA